MRCFLQAADLCDLALIYLYAFAYELSEHSFACSLLVVPMLCVLFVVLEEDVHEDEFLLGDHGS